MAEVVKEPRRGDMFWVRDTVTIGSEESFKRPGLVVSSDVGNESNNPTVILAHGTTKNKFGRINVPVMSAGRQVYIMCNQLFTADRTRLCGYMGTLSDAEMAEVDRTLCIVMGLRDDSDDDSWEDEKRELLEEIESLKSQLAGEKDSETKDTVSKDMWKRLYEKALDELVSVRMALDLSERMKTPEPKVEKMVVEAPTVEAPTVEEPEPKVEINSCTEDELRSVGCAPTIARYIVVNRPYKSVSDLKRIPQMTRMAYQILESRICCVPQKKEESKKVEEPKVKAKVKAKVNVNTATAKEMQAAGLPKGLSEHIRAYRNKHGNFEKLEDLLNVDLFGEVCMKRYGSMLEV